MMQARKNKEIAEALIGAQTIAICSHVNPDGDTVGSALTMRIALEKMGKEVSLFCADKIPDNLMYLPGAEDFRTRDGITGMYDLLLAVDVSDRSRLGECDLLLEKCARTAQIDHHPTNCGYADINSIDGEAAATCVIIWDQLKQLTAEPDRDMAICMYTGISTDTGNFSFSCTNSEAFSVMSELMRIGLPLQDLNRRLFREKSRPQVLLLGRALNSIRYLADGKLAVMTLTLQDFSDCNALQEHADTLVNYGMDTEHAEMALLARETPDGKIKMSLRAAAPQTVSDIARMYGGGGHPQASGITMDGLLTEATESVVSDMIKKLTRQDVR